MMKLKDMNRDALAKLATEHALPNRSKMTRGVLEAALLQQELDTRVARYPGAPGAILTPKQARRVKQKMNRQR